MRLQLSPYVPFTEPDFKRSLGPTQKSFLFSRVIASTDACQNIHPKGRARSTIELIASPILHPQYLIGDRKPCSAPHQPHGALTHNANTCVAPYSA